MEKFSCKYMACTSFKSRSIKYFEKVKTFVLRFVRSSFRSFVCSFVNNNIIGFCAIANWNHYNLLLFLCWAFRHTHADSLNVTHPKWDEKESKEEKNIRSSCIYFIGFIDTPFNETFLAAWLCVWVSEWLDSFVSIHRNT